MSDQIEGTAIEIVGSHDMIAYLQDVLQGIGNSRCSRSDSQSGHTTLQGCHTILEHTLCGVGQSTVDITRIAQTKTVGSML